MTVMDRYVLRHFLQVFVICFCSLTGLGVVIDAFSNLDDFLNYADGRGNVLQIMGQYYAYRTLGFFNELGPVLTLISAMFTVTWLRRHNELTALSAAGIRNARVVAPILIAAVVISLGIAASRELLVPRYRYELSHKIQDLSGAAERELRPRYDHQTDVRIGGAGTFADTKRIREPSFILPESLDDYGRKLIAEQAFYQPPHDGRPGGYLLDGVSEPKLLSKKPSLPLGSAAAGSADEGPGPIIITPGDALWLDDDQCFVVSNVQFDQLEDSAVWRQYASTSELMAGLRNPSLD
jgi:lipopolysaccharide export system permease protein